MAISKPEVDASNYFIDDNPTATPKHGTTVQSGWGAVAALAKPKREAGSYPTDFKVSETARLIRFLEDDPFAVYKQHWVQLPTDSGTMAWRSYVCTGSDTPGQECPLCAIAGDMPRSKAAFNVLVVSDEEPTVQILHAPVTLARQLQAAHEDPRRGPLSKYYWAISRLGVGRETQYTIERVRPTELTDEWELDAEELNAIANSAVKYDASAIYVSPHEDMVQAARKLVG
jgi:hypothetical protein